MRKSGEKPWLVTGCAGFIGSHLLEALLKQGETVIGLDNLSSGSLSNIKKAIISAGDDAKSRFLFAEGDINDVRLLKKLCRGVRFVLHHAAQVSVPESIKNPSLSARVNVEGLINLLRAAQSAGVERVVYASSSAVYGSLEGDFHQEQMTGPPVSPYAAGKIAAESFAQAMSVADGGTFIGLRYFNVFGPRQNPAGPYASVIPRWISRLKSGKKAQVFGDSGITRDFVYVGDVVKANLLAAHTAGLASHEIFNIAYGQSVSLRELFDCIVAEFEKAGVKIKEKKFTLDLPRQGDIMHSAADISKARRILGYSPQTSLAEGIGQTIRRQFKIK